MSASASTPDWVLFSSLSTRDHSCKQVTLEQINPLDLLINLGCPDEHEGMKLSQYIDGCPNPDDVTECPSPPTKICVYWWVLGWWVDGMEGWRSVC